MSKTYQVTISDPGDSDQQSPPQMMRRVTNYAEFKSAALDNPAGIYIDGEIHQSDQEAVVGHDTTLMVSAEGRYVFENPGDQLIVNGPVHGLRQIFYGAEPGQVIGKFGGLPRLPEWWWNRVGDATKGINCALRSGLWYIALEGEAIRVKLQSRHYMVAGTVDCRGFFGEFYGAGLARSRLVAMPEFKGAVFLTDDYPLGTQFQVLIGGVHQDGADTAQSRLGASHFRLRDFGVDGTAATTGPKNQVPLSGIGATGWTQEGVELTRMFLQGHSRYALSFGVGSSKVMERRNDANGLKIEDCTLGYQRQQFGAPAPLPVRFFGGRNVRLAGSTILGRSFDRESKEVIAPVAIATQLQSLQIDRCHLESGKAVVLVEESFKPGSSFEIGAGLSMRDCDSTHGVEDMVKILSNAARIDLSGLQIVYNANMGGTPNIVNDVPRDFKSQGILNPGGLNCMLSYRRAYNGEMIVTS